MGDCIIMQSSNTMIIIHDSACAVITADTGIEAIYLCKTQSHKSAAPHGEELIITVQA